MSTNRKSPDNSRGGRSSSSSTLGETQDAIEPHAQLRDQQGRLLAGIVRRDGEWVLGMGGRIAGSSTEAVQVFALIRRAAELQEEAGTPVRLTWSDELKHQVDKEITLLGITLEQFERELRSSIGQQPD